MTEADGAASVGPMVRAGLLVGLFPLVIGGLAAAGGGFSLPSMFVGFALIALTLALGAVWQSLRTALGGGPEVGVGLNAGHAEREALLAEKETLLTTIKDITFDHEVGKIDDADFERMNRTYRSRAKEVLRQLDQDLGPYLDEASKLVDGATAKADRRAGRRKKRRKKPRVSSGIDCASCGRHNDPDAMHCDQCGQRLGVAVCPSCETENDPDAKFCKRCATALGETPTPAGKKRRSKPGVLGAKAADPTEDAEPAATERASDEPQPEEAASEGVEPSVEADSSDAVDEPDAGEDPASRGARA